MLTKEFLAKYLVKDPPKHEFYPESIKIKTNLQYHSKGVYPAELIDAVRPNEDVIYKEYRKKNYKPITKTWFSKVVTTIAKIGRAEDWSITFKEGIADDFEEYTTKIFPHFDSLENWFFTVAMPYMCDDPNSVCAIFPLPKEDPNDDTEMLQPFPYLFKSDNVIDFKENRYAVLLATEKSYVEVGDTKVKEGLIYYFLDRDQLVKAVQVGKKEDFKFEYEGGEQGYTLNHNSGYLPAFKLGGIIEEFEEGELLYDSFIGDCVPYWHEAINRYSDHQVNMVLHLHPDRWEIQDTECRTCKGSGILTETVGDKVHKGNCGDCHGRGSVSVKTPFGVKLIKAAQKTGPNESINIPTPPMGYANRPIESIQFLKTEVKDNIKDGLSAINLEFLMSTPLDTSGISKAYDREPADSFFHTIARHIVENVLKPAYFFTAKWRYGKVMTEKQIAEIVPDINIPTKYDILSADILAQRLTNAKNADLSPAIRKALEIEYAEAEFGEDSVEAIAIRLSSQLDPLPNKNEEEKMTELSNKGCTQLDYVLSCKLSSFITRAMFEEKTFLDMDYQEKLNVITGYAQETIKENTLKIVPLVDEEGNAGKAA